MADDTLVNQTTPGDDIPFGNTESQPSSDGPIMERAPKLTKPIPPPHSPDLGRPSPIPPQGDPRDSHRKANAITGTAGLLSQSPAELTLERQVFLSVIAGMAAHGDLTQGNPKLQSDGSVAIIAKHAAGVATYLVAAAKAARL